MDLYDLAAIAAEAAGAGNVAIPLVHHLTRQVAADTAAVNARTHIDTPMPGRTWLQQATPVTFGLKAAGWVDALDRQRRPVAAALEAACVLQLGDASGTLASR